MMKLRFGYANTRMNEKYSGKDGPREHLARWTKAWGEEPQQEWMHIFCHTLDAIPINVALIIIKIILAQGKNRKKSFGTKIFIFSIFLISKPSTT